MLPLTKAKDFMVAGFDMRRLSEPHGIFYRWYEADQEPIVDGFHIEYPYPFTIEQSIATDWRLA